MELTIEEAIQRGVSAHKEGKLEEAEQLYRYILDLQPNHPHANHNLGSLAIADNKLNTALPLFKIALRANPRIQQFWFSYIDVLIRSNKLDDAKTAINQAKNQGVDLKRLNSLSSRLPNGQQIETKDTTKPFLTRVNYLLKYYKNGQYEKAANMAKSILRQTPDHQLSWKVLGVLSLQNGRNVEAFNFTRKAVQLNPKDVLALSNLGVMFKELGRHKDSKKTAKQATILEPTSATAQNNFGNTLQDFGKLKESVKTFKYAITLRPNYTDAYNNICVALQELGRLNEAEIYCKRGLILKLNYAELNYNLGIIQKEQHQPEKATVSYKKAIVLNSNYAKAYNNLGIIHQEMGSFKAAEICYKKAIFARPDYAEAYRHISMIKKFTSRDEQFLKMQELYHDAKSSEQQRCQYSFGLAKALEDLGDFKQAFYYYCEGNAIRKKNLNYNLSIDSELFKNLKVTSPIIEKTKIEINTNSHELTPVFIVGMPRSGTTLVEQIISSHSQVTGAGELPFVAQFGASIAQGSCKINKSSLVNFRKNYLEKLSIISKSSPIVTDKMPHNFLYIGLISHIFPEAKIVHVKRNPAAVCWGNYKQFFSSQTLGYCYALDDVVGYYKLYEDIMRFWSKTITTRIYNLSYESLTVNQEKETRGLIRHLDLQWENNCLFPHKNKRNITTAFSIQVRDKIYKGSSRHWEKYKPFLGGILDPLDESDDRD